LRMLKICVSVNRFFFMSNSLKLKDFRLILNCPIFRGAYNLVDGICSCCIYSNRANYGIQPLTFNFTILTMLFHLGLGF
jgi:hypothetical protein